jgi:PAS domain S-box-containing protein
VLVPSLGEQILRGQGPEFADLVESLGEALTVRDRDGEVVYANRAALRSLGFETLEDLRRHGLEAVMADYVVHDEHGREVSMDDIPGVRLLAGEPNPPPLLLHSVNRLTGEARWELLKASPLRNAEGEMIAAATMIEDVTAVKTAEVHTSVLAKSGRLLSASLDYQQTLHNVAQSAIPGLVDWCMVELVGREGQREQIVIAHRDAAQRELAVRMRELESAKPRSDQAVARVLASGESVLFFDVTEEHLVRVAQSEEQLEILRALHIRSAIVVPMRVPSRTIGAMSFFTSESRRRLTDADVELAEQLARRAAVAVENSRLHTQLAEVAETLQNSLLPSEIPEVPDWEIAALYRPAETEQRIDVGGDFYEVFEAQGCTLALIGDVTGHGVAAASATALMRHGARFASRLEPNPMAILGRLDEELRRGPGTAMCTALCAALQEGGLTMCSAGHPPALIVDRAGTVSEAPAPGPLLGAFPDSVWQQEHMPVSAGELVLMYTDGVTETIGDTDRFGVGRLRRLLSGHADASPAQLLAVLEEALAEFRGGPPTDDVAALALRPLTGR